MLQHSKNWGTKVGYNGYVVRAIEDLVAGRISFIEVPDRGNDRISKYFLADRKSILCAPTKVVEMLIGSTGYLPISKCLGMEEVTKSAARYVVTGYDSRGTGNQPSVFDLKSDKEISKLRWFSHKITKYLLFSKGESLSCPSSYYYPKQVITAFTFMDRFKFTWEWNENLKLPNEFFNRFGTFTPEKTKADFDIEDMPQKKCTDNISKVINDNETFTTVKIKVYKGKHEKDINLDSNTNKTTAIDVFVNKTEDPYILFLNGYDPIVWNIHQEQGANILAIFADGNHGKAVIGPDKNTEVFVYTGHHNPGINCSRSDFYTALNLPISGSRHHDLEKYAGDSFVIGGQYLRASSYITSDYYKLEDFAFSRESNE